MRRGSYKIAAMGLVAMWMASRVDYHIYHKLASTLAPCQPPTAVLFMPDITAASAIGAAGLGTLQPSEIAKFAVVLVFAHIIALNHDRMGSFAVGVVPCAGAGGGGDTHAAGAPPSGTVLI